MNNYTYLLVKQLFLELFCTTRTRIADPQIQHRKRTSFLVIEEGDHEEESRPWVMDEETLEEGLLSLCNEEIFWVLQANGFYQRKRAQGRTFRKNSEKEKEAARRVEEKTWL